MTLSEMQQRLARPVVFGDRDYDYYNERDRYDVNERCLNEGAEYYSEQLEEDGREHEDACTLEERGCCMCDLPF